MKLSEHLVERLFYDVDKNNYAEKRIGGGHFVLYWMCTAMRAYENPALDVAIEMANHLQVPVLIYQGLSERYPYASDRHHQFILEGARDVQIQCKKRNIPYLFHLETRQDRKPYLRILAQMSCLVVTEYFPTPPIQKIVQKLKKSLDIPVWLVDCSCLVSMKKTNREWTRAFHFRDYFDEYRKDILSEQWMDATLERTSIQISLPLHSIDLQKADLSHLISLCDIDHTIPPVPLEGGSTAGYLRFEKFKKGALGRYDKNRNNPLVDGVSRLSAYFHYGMISVFQIVREVHQHGGEGALKFLDELLIWRELSYHWCHMIKYPHTLSILPIWAQKTLDEHKMDERHLESYENLIQAKTKDRFWNICQKSLIFHGELHNNIRMTWGKMFLFWTKDPQTCLRYLIDLNHRYALDGRDPASYGGLLWCMGLFDRPFKPENLITGTVRQRLSSLHANRLPVDKLEQKIATIHKSLKIGIIGAGISGLISAGILHKYGVDVEIFDKGRGVGGRTSTRISRDDASWVFDHGAPFFFVDDKRMLYWTKQWENSGIVCLWKAKFQKIKSTQRIEKEMDCWLAQPKMSSLAEHLATYIPESKLHCNHQVTRLVWKQQKWFFYVDEKRFGPYDEIISTVPYPQLQNLIPEQIGLTKQENASKHLSQWVVLIRCLRLGLEHDIYEFSDDVIRMAICERNKPNHKWNSDTETEDWVFHAQTQWSEENIERDSKQVAETIMSSFTKILQIKLFPLQTQIHRWRYAHVQSNHRVETDRDYEYNSDFHLYRAGDAFAFFGQNNDVETSSLRMQHTGIQRAVLSGQAVAGAILRNYHVHSS